MKERVIRAVYDKDTITVYQAYNTSIALKAIQNQTFIFPFKIDRMTWIKPSFLWMMYRSNWGKKDMQNHILEIRIKKMGFEWALKNACLSHFVKSSHHSYEAWRKSLKKSPVRIQWDPEKDIFLNNLPYRSIQIGLSGIAVKKYVNDWIVSITDISKYCNQIHELVLEKRTKEALDLLPAEKIYNLSDELKKIIYIS